MNPLDRPTLEEFVRQAADAVDGDWVILGGTVLPLLGAGDRATFDIDLVPVADASQSDVIMLMEIAEGLGLPVESVNQAGAFFLRKIPDFEEHLVLLHEGSRARILRPDPTLYVSLKVGRLSESDLEDCFSFLIFAHSAGESLDRPRLVKLLRQEIRAAGSERRRQRLESLLDLIVP